MTETRIADEILKKPTPTQRPAIKEKHYRTLHKRDVTLEEYFVVARFAFALTRVTVPGAYRIPQVLDLGNRDLHLPEWYKTGEGWKVDNYKARNKEALGIPVAMMRAISRKLGISESMILKALHSLSMISVDLYTIAEGPRRYRQLFSGKLINPVDGNPLNFAPFKDVEGFVLDKKRVNEWIKKDLKKREQPGG